MPMTAPTDMLPPPPPPVLLLPRVVPTTAATLAALQARTEHLEAVVAVLQESLDGMEAHLARQEAFTEDRQMAEEQRIQLTTHASSSSSAAAEAAGAACTESQAASSTCAAEPAGIACNKETTKQDEEEWPWQWTEWGDSLLSGSHW